ncbi:MAG: GTPase HflX, partial [Mucinivorans sp.]
MERGNFLDRAIERAVLVGVITPAVGERTAAEYLDELAFLAKTAGAQTVKIFTQKLATPHRSTFVGQGKLEEIKVFCADNQIDTVIFDDELTPSQLRNLERELEMKILDRTNLILDIFAARATTAYAKTQVELAQYQYLLPRLTGMWTHLERQRGGIGMRGPGETEIETDRRIIRDKIARLKEQLAKIDRQMATQRSSRGAMVRVALVGYTNVGKSTLM